MRTFLKALPLLILGLAPTSLAETAAGEAEQPIRFDAQNARVLHARDSAKLTASGEGHLDIRVREILSQQFHNTRTIDSLVTLRTNRRSGGLTHLRLVQKVGGLEVFGTYIKASFNDQSELISLIENLAPVPAEGVTPVRANAREALHAALKAHALNGRAQEVGAYGDTIVYQVEGDFFRHPTVKRVAIPMTSGAMREGFLVEIWTGRSNQLWHVLVSGEGRVLGSQLRTSALTDTYHIFPEHPGTTPQTLADGPGAGNAESPIGWLSGGQTTVEIRGNNVHAYLDADANNVPDGGGNPVTNGHFLASANLGQDPRSYPNKEVAVQNLFYFINVIHDKLYRHGFDEAAGNFQNDNFGVPGGGDAVNAEAQDGSGVNNANFSTPSDGSPGRMQMFLWTTASPGRDGALDSDLIWHEYCHGLTWRMIGNMSGPLAGAIGEGMSDGCAILANGQDTLAEYSLNDPFGVRKAQYTGYPLTYGDVSGDNVHSDGEIYAATLWDLRQAFLDHSIALDTLWDYLVDGMNFTPAGPAMEDMRDGILTAAYGTGHECVIWGVFADHGIGEGADGMVSGGGPFGGGEVSVTESFALPASCNGCTQLLPGASCVDDSHCCSGNCLGNGLCK
jgi:hypothetical protein